LIARVDGRRSGFDGPAVDRGQLDPRKARLDRFAEKEADLGRRGRNRAADRRDSMV
jgi:hypothetical protein